ncbi:hypothetical protein HanRHA438_Chr04g0168521 [Helianthus annuus]|nr:hypothetical protein HanHA300_Chr04g0130201 [Helianthus annuus]KAJ0588113.1 hypothetical protein HanIR_Chr04g0170841 [Helianthus annuus]KAJ0596481.1 hypothetical protein HanHA89_Chr04g0143241 [Helianthus annuus]KAJ0757141.1 hypothetical protein HanLR1_Chr04g0135161 [Helianthus annuus]KAJ0926218.1 hypothetical protein HanRHA438_Chr04g0168521 [Helianthus annuus]
MNISQGIFEHHIMETVTAAGKSKFRRNYQGNDLAPFILSSFKGKRSVLKVKHCTDAMILETSNKFLTGWIVRRDMVGLNMES